MEVLDILAPAATEARPGYKLTTLGWLPAGWEVVRIKEIATVSSGSTPSRSKGERYFLNGTIPWVKTMDLTRGWVSRTEECITEAGLEESSCRLYQPETVLVAMYGGYNQIGRTGILKQEAAINQAISAIEVDRSLVLPEYLLAWLNTNVEYWKNFAASSRKDPNITGKDVQDFPVVLPSLAEQHEIIKVKRSLNNVIHTLTDLLHAKRRYQQGLMQQLLTGQRRFPEFAGQAWREVRLSEFLTESRLPGSTGETARKLTVRLYGKGVFAKQERGGSVNTKYFTRRAGQLIYSKLDFLNGAFGLIPEHLDGYESTLDLPAFDISPDADADFLLAYFSRPEFYSLFTDVAAGGRKAVRIAPEELLRKKLLLPSLPEQRRIAAVLTALATELHLLATQRAHWQQQKQGLLQALLTGAVRVNNK